jgi:Flp pilus assembly protein protease CpaA
MSGQVKEGFNFRFYILGIMAGLDDLAKDTIVNMVVLSLVTVVAVLILHFEGELGNLSTELLLMFIIDTMLYGIYKVLKSR